MVEAIVGGTLAIVGGGYTVITALHRRISNVDTRLDRIELSLARDYIPRSEFIASQAKLEEHMVRIETKLDRMLERHQRLPSPFLWLFLYFSILQLNNFTSDTHDSSHGLQKRVFVVYR